MQHIIQRLQKLAARPVPVDKTKLTEVINNFSTWVKKEYGSKLLEKVNQTQAKPFIEENLRLKNPKGDDVLVTMVIKPSNKFGASFVDAKTGHKFIQVFYPSDLTWREVLSANTIKRLYISLLHEATHAVDIIKKHEFDDKLISDADKRISLEERGIDFKEYVNNPVELRAFMQQIIEEVLEVSKNSYFQKDIQKVPVNKRKQEWVKNALEDSETWEKVSYYLNVHNKNKILKAVYTAIEEAGYWG